jgi:signal transduction histidine kinase
MGGCRWRTVPTMTRDLGDTSLHHTTRAAVLASAVAAGSLAGHYLATGRDSTTQSLDWLGYALLALGAAALAARRRAPRAVLVVTAVAVTVTFVLDIDHNGPFVILPVMVALYTATEAGLRRAAIITAAAVIAALGLLVIGFSANADGDDTQGLLWATGWLAASVVAGEVVKGRRDYIAAVEARAVEAERTREEEARRRAGDERLRIAREVHDVLGHSLSLINVQAGTAAHVIDRQPEKAREALEIIKQASKQALQDLRGTLEALQESHESAPRVPSPGLQRLDHLVGLVAASGVDVDVTVTGDPRPLPATVDLAAYRIVQESLTNVLRHARSTTAAVRLSYGEHELDIEVEDNGVGVTDRVRRGSGDGVDGMRARAAALGGQLEVARRSQGGTRVQARLPLVGAP